MCYIFLLDLSVQFCRLLNFLKKKIVYIHVLGLSLFCMYALCMISCNMLSVIEFVKIGQECLVYVFIDFLIQDGGLFNEEGA